MSTDRPKVTYAPAEVKVIHSGHQVIYSFPNGHKASVVRHDYSYGGPDGYWELAVLDSNNKINYSTPVTGDVLGWLNDQNVQEALDSIAAL